MAKKLITMAEYARRRQLNRSTISRHVMAGLIPTHGPRRLIDPREADRQLGKHLDPARTKAKATETETTGAGLKAARARHAYWKAELARLELEEKRKQVRETAHYREIWAKVSGVLRTAALPGEVAKRAAAESDMLAVVRILNSSIRALLEGLANEVKRVAAASAAVGSDAGEREGIPDPSNYRQSLARKERYMAEVKKLKAGLKEGRYVYEHEVARAMGGAFQGLKQRLMGIPNRAAAEVSATTDAEKVNRVLQEAVDEAFKDLPEDITEGLTVVTAGKDEDDGTEEPD